MAQGDIDFLDDNNTNVVIVDENGRRQRASLVVVANGLPEINKPLNTALQDQFSPLVDRFLTRKLSDVTLLNDASFGATTITLSPGHGFTNGPAATEMIEIDYLTSQYQSRVKSVAGDVITVTNPLCCAIPAGTAGARVSPDGNVNGSVTPVVMQTSPPDGVLWDINILSINMLDATAMDDSTFGGISGFTGSVLYRTVNDVMAENIFTAIDNGCYKRHCDTEDPYSDKAPAGLYGFNAKRRFNGQQGDGVSRRIGGDYHTFQAVISGDLTGLDRFWNVVRGHVVED
jgi:hypothetical protein